MNQQLVRELQEQLEGMQKYQSFQNKIDSMTKEVNAVEKEVLELTTAYEKEQKDVTVLEKGSLQAFYYKVMGKYEETREKEILEAATARVRLEEKQYELQEIQKNIESMKREQSAYYGCKEKYQRLYQQKLDEIVQEDSNLAKEIIELQVKSEKSKHNIKEINEAIAVGNKVLAKIDSVADCLSSARSWGTWDIVGGGMLSDLMKHSKIDDAKDKVREAKSLIRSFRTELADVNLSFDVSLNTDGFSKFADFFFDGLFADLNMQNRIAEAQNSVSSAKTKINHTMIKLNQLLRQEEGIIQQTKRKIEQLVNQAN